MAIDNKFKYTNKDTQSFLRELIKVTPELSQAYDPQSEQDPVTFIVKNISYVGDVLSFYLDSMAQETAPRTMTQRKVANAYYRMMGYYMEWFRPARSRISIKNKGTSVIRIPKYTEFISLNGDTVAVLLEEGISILPGDTKSDIYVYEGSVINEELGSIYSVVDNMYKLNKSSSSTMMIDSTRVHDSSNSEWIRVEDIDKYPQLGKFYDVTADDFDNLSVRFSPYINTTTSTISYIRYLSSKGEGASILKDSLNKCRMRLPEEARDDEQYSNIIPNNVEVIETDLSETPTKGYETPAEAYANSQFYINTTDTLITVVDYKNAIRRIPKISNCVVTDIVTETAVNKNRPDVTDKDVQYPLGSELDGLTYRVRYVVDNFNFGIEKAIVGGYIDNQIDMFKSVNLQRRLSQDYYIMTWQPKGTITLSEAINQEEADNLLSKICKRLSDDYHPRNVEFGTSISLLKLIESIKSYDDRIILVDLQPVRYHITKALVGSTSDSECTDDISLLYRDYVMGTGLSPDGKRHWTKWNSYNANGSGNQNSGLRVDSIIANNILITNGDYTNELYNKVNGLITTDPGKLLLADTVLDPADFFHITHPYRRISIPRFASYKYYESNLTALALFKEGIIINKESIK